MVVAQSYVEPVESELNRNLEYKAAEDKKMNELHERAIVLDVCKISLFKWGAAGPAGVSLCAL